MVAEQRADDPRNGAEGQGEGGFSVEERLRRLEEIVGELEEEGLELDRALALFEEGVRLVKETEAALARAELRVEELLGEGEEIRLRLLSEEGG